MMATSERSPKSLGDSVSETAGQLCDWGGGSRGGGGLISHSIFRGAGGRLKTLFLTNSL